jgi:hemolysin type calcium-binding protein
MTLRASALALVLIAVGAAPAPALAQAPSDGATLVGGDVRVVRAGTSWALQGTIVSPRPGCGAGRDVDVSIGAGVIATPRTDAAGEWTVPIAVAEVPERVGLAVRASTLADGSPCDATTGAVDTIFASPEVGRRVSGGARSDGIVGRASNDRLAGGGGDDRIAGRGGDDRIAGGDGADDLDGGAGRDRLTGGRGEDTLTGGAGRDVLDGGAGDDRLTDTAGATVVRTGAGHDTVDVRDGRGDDRVDCPPSSDAVVYADAGDRVAATCGRPRLGAPPRGAGIEGPVGPGCFSFGNGGSGTWPADGLVIANIGIDSFDTTLRWQKSIACPLWGGIGIDTQETIDQWWLSVSEDQLAVYSNGGRYEDWHASFRHADPTETHRDNARYMLPNQLMKVRGSIFYALQTYATPWREIRFKNDPATGLELIDRLLWDNGPVETEVDPTVSAYGDSQIRLAARDPSDPTSRFEDAISDGVRCDTGRPQSRFAKRTERQCKSRYGEYMHVRADTYASSSRTVCGDKPTPCRVPFKRGATYEVRLVVDNTWSTRTWGPIRTAVAGA